MRQVISREAQPGSAEALRDSLDKLAETALRVKRERDALLEAAKVVVARWSSGDLAEAVRWLSSTIQDIEETQ
jgi:hypothetical protein